MRTCAWMSCLYALYNLKQRSARQWNSTTTFWQKCAASPSPLSPSFCSWRLQGPHAPAEISCYNCGKKGHMGEVVDEFYSVLFDCLMRFRSAQRQTCSNYWNTGLLYRNQFQRKNEDENFTNLRMFLVIFYNHFSCFSLVLTGGLFQLRFLCAATLMRLCSSHSSPHLRPAPSLLPSSRLGLRSFRPTSAALSHSSPLFVR